MNMKMNVPFYFYSIANQDKSLTTMTMTIDDSNMILTLMP